MRTIIAAGLLAFCGMVHAGALEERQAALREHLKTHGTQMAGLSEPHFVRRCEVVLELVETRLADYDNDYLSQVYRPWRNHLRQSANQARLDSIASGKGGGDLPARAASVKRRIAQLQANPTLAGTGLGPSSSGGASSSGGSGSGAGSMGGSAEASKAPERITRFGTLGGGGKGSAAQTRD
jgi:hypothetical protein